MTPAQSFHSPPSRAFSGQRSSRFRAALLGGWAFCSLLGSLPADIPSGPTDISRYQKIWDISPFVAVTDLSGQADDMAGRFSLTGFARMGEKDVVFVFDRTTLERFTLTVGETRSGVALQNLQHNGDLRSVRATLAIGGRTLEIGYDATATPESGSAAPVIPGHMQQGHRGFPGQPQPGMPPGGQPQPGMPPGGQPQAPPMSNPNAIIGAPPATAAPNPAEQAPPPRRVIRRRAIVAPE